MIFCLQISFFSENTCVGVWAGRGQWNQVQFFLLFGWRPLHRNGINGINMCAMHERQQEEAEPWLKSGISGWIREETNANMSKAAGVGNHFYLWITPYNWDDLRIIYFSVLWDTKLKINGLENDFSSFLLVVQASVRPGPLDFHRGIYNINSSSQQRLIL